MSKNNTSLPPKPSSPVPGSRWRHFKRNEYTVFRVARDCEDPSRFLVIYEDSKGETWAREHANFLGVHENGKKRFTECTCKAIQENMEPDWVPTEQEPHHPDCPATEVTNVQ